MAKTLWPDKDPFAQCLIVDDRPCARVVGVVADMHRQGLREDPFMQYFLPLATSGDAAPQALLVASDRPPETLAEPVRWAMLGLRTDLPFAQIESYEQLIAPEGALVAGRHAHRLRGAEPAHRGDRGVRHAGIHRDPAAAGAGGLRRGARRIAAATAHPGGGVGHRFGAPTMEDRGLVPEIHARLRNIE